MLAKTMIMNLYMFSLLIGDSLAADLKNILIITIEHSGS